MKLPPELVYCICAACLWYCASAMGNLSDEFFKVDRSFTQLVGGLLGLSSWAVASIAWGTTVMACFGVMFGLGGNQ
jgi:hypothetical protein